MSIASKVIAHSRFSEFDVSLFQAGKHYKLYERFGAHCMEVDGTAGVYFAVWAPAASRVEVVGDFNHWNGADHALNVRWDSSGIWEGFIPEAAHGMRYKFRIHSSHGGEVLEKIDPYARRFEEPPLTASIIWNTDDYAWQDSDWMAYRQDKNGLDKPYAVYEVHLASWRQAEGGRCLTYEELADQLVAYVCEMQFTHVEFMPVMEYPYGPSWGYQVTGYFAPSARFGSPQGLMHLIDRLHQHDIGLILDWVPAHFPEDEHALARYDGTHLYEHPDRRKGFHPDWKSLIFNYERNEVRSFLISNAVYWLEQFHADGLRVDAVASMLYLDYSREEGEWEPNEHGGNEYLAAASFIRDFNQAAYAHADGIQTIAEESTAYNGVTKPVDAGGLGFGMKWMMGWMNDSLEYFARDPIHRKHHHNEITFSLAYAFSERYMLPLSHDEVVHGKGSLLSKMPGDEWQRFANLRLLYGLMYMHPGMKLMFQGGEFGQYDEWNFAQSLDWNLLEFLPHLGMKEYVKQLNGCFRQHPALYEKAFAPDGFEWIDYGDWEASIVAFIRKGHDPENDLVVACNFTPTPHSAYRLGVHRAGILEEVFNSDRQAFGGSDLGNDKPIKSETVAWHGRERSAEIILPPLAVVAFKLV